MTSTSKSEQQSKLSKDNVEEFVEPLLNRILSSVQDPNEENIKKIRELIERTQRHLAGRQKWNSMLMDNLGKIERQIDYYYEEKGGVHGEPPLSKIEESSEGTWKELIKNLTKLLNKPPMVTTVADQHREGLSVENTINEVNEPSSIKNIEENGSTVKFEELRKRLKLPQKNWLYSLSIFPIKAELKKKFLIYWWIGLGIEHSRGNANTTVKQLEELEKLAEEFFSYLVGYKILIEEYTRKHNKVIDQCLIDPEVHRQLIAACERDGKLITSQNDEQTWRSYRDDSLGTNLAALLNVKGKYLKSKDIIKNISGNKNGMQVVQLGRWDCKINEKIVSREERPPDQIEVDETDFLKKLGKKVTFLSLRSFSRIEELPESIGKLGDLRILDLRACHNLKNLPRKQQSKFLKLTSREEKWFNNLTHLDISECYLLNHMPKWVCELSNLMVLKGFVVGRENRKKQFCRLGDLAKLKNLRKLSIRILKDLDLQEFSHLQPLDRLSVLTIIWGIHKQSDQADGKNQNKENDQASVNNSGIEGQNNNENDDGRIQAISFPKSLEKLDIRCYPKGEAVELLDPAVLPNVKRLYIRGGNLTTIAHRSGWKIEILRLRFLKYFDSDWNDLISTFTNPNLKHVEFLDCPQLENVPRDRNAWNAATDGPFPRIDDVQTVTAAQEIVRSQDVELKIRKYAKAELGKEKKKMMLELSGVNTTHDRPGLSLVAVLYVGTGMQKDNMLRKLKNAMLFLIKKLSSADRLSIVTFDGDTRIKHLSELLWMDKSFKEKSEYLVENLVIQDPTNGAANNARGNIIAALKVGLNILKNINSPVGIILMSYNIEIPRGSVRSIPSADNVTVHTIGYGESLKTYESLKAIANSSRGGTFSEICKTDNLTETFAVCLGGLLKVAAQDLTLTLTPIKGASKLELVSSGTYQDSKNNGYSPVTIKFGDLYAGEVRKVLVELLHPADNKAGFKEILRVSYSYKVSGKLINPDPVDITIRRVETVPAHKGRVPPEVIAEDSRLKAVEKIKQAIRQADHNLTSARANINDALNILKEIKQCTSNPSFGLLPSELQEMDKVMESKESYKLRCAFAYSLLSSIDTQRAAARGDDIGKSLSFATPFMRKLLKQAKEFDADPTFPLTSVDEDLD